MDLYELVVSLSQEEKQQFRKFVSRGASGKSALFMDLYEALQRQGVYDEAAVVKRVFAGQQGRFKSTCRYLTQMLLESLAHFSVQGPSRLRLVEVAVDRGYPELARKNLQAELQVAWESWQIGYMQDLMRWVELLERHYGLTTELPERCPGAADLRRWISWKTEMDQMLGEVKQALILKGAGAGEDLAGVAAFLEGLEAVYLPVVLRVSYLRLRSLVAFGQAQRSEAAAFQVQLLQAIRQAPDAFRKEEQLQEYSRTITFLIQEKDFAGAQKLLFEVGMFPADNRLQEDMVLREWVTKAIYIASLSGQYALGQRALQELQRNEELFKSFVRAYLYHLGSLLEMRRDNWEAVLEYQSKVNVHQVERLSSFFWGKPLIGMLARIEQGELSQAKAIARRWEERIGQADASYPARVLQLLSAYIQSVETESDPKLGLSMAKSRITELLVNPSENHHANFFNILPWINSKLSGEKIEFILEKDESQYLVAGIA